ncbi:AAA family ATPase [Piscinibacter koreensis]|uniref:CbbQ/NirQ/NorQ/GpvN family protein n=1 Tax=Piscinibacter koreensis TaxID=2742824 RepID=A0A7Y6TWQ2_9BURK|nr:CbbQ/NirQ/NorQ/GpvN family protein [Schlegelella koreensis]
MHPLDAWRVGAEPFYQEVGAEVALFEAAYARRLPLLLKGPTGCGKTRFVEYMAWRLGRPLVTVACNDDLSANDLVGRWLLDADGTRWQDGPLTLAARYGAICYLDEIVEARADTAVVIHPLTDTRRMLPVGARNEIVRAHPDFALAVSYNPGADAREMKTSTRQRFCALAFDYPAREAEAAIVARESGIAPERAAQIVGLGIRTRRLQGQGLDEGASTRMLVQAATLVAQGVALGDACRMALLDPLTDDPATRQALEGALDAAL